MSYAAKPIEELDALPAADFVAELAPLFEGAPTLLGRLASDRPFGSWWNLLARARVVAHALPEAEKIELLDSHPRLGAPPDSVSALSHEEQGYGRGGTDDAEGYIGAEAWPAEDLPPPGHEPAEPAPPPSPPPATGQPGSMGLRGRLEHRATSTPPAEPVVWGSASSAGAAPIRTPATPPVPTPPVQTGGTDEGDTTRAKLARLNAAYEDWFGFRYCVFVAGRPLEALIPELEKALAQSRESELQRGVDAVVDIAVARSGTAR